MALEQVVADSVRSLGFDLVELERLAGGLLRVTIDTPWQPETAAERSVGVDDCERVSHQLQYALEVEGVDYQRLEVSSPGIDRPLRGAADFARFSGARVELKFREPVQGDGADGGRVFHGILGPADDADHWQLGWNPEAGRGDHKQRGRTGRARQADEITHVMTFALDELASARLAPVLDFKRGRRAAAPGAGGDVHTGPTE